MMSAKAAAAVIRAFLESSRGFLMYSFFQTVHAIERQPKVVLMLGVRWVWKL